MQTRIEAHREALDAWTREIVQWHFSPETGCPFWLEYAKSLDWDPRKEIKSYADLSRFGFFQDEWLRAAQAESIISSPTHGEAARDAFP